MKKYLTLRELGRRELGRMEACEEARNSFRAIFGKRATIKAVVYRLQNPGKRDKYIEDYKSWLSWLMAQTPELTAALLKAGVDVHVDNDYALRWAAKFDHIKIVKILLKAGADVHADNDYALRWAAENGNTEIVKILLKAGADVHADNDYAFRWAVRNGHTEVVKILKRAMKAEKRN